jgi:1,4-dihydroxy-2-naphthoyl-CoA hydrolase
MATNVPQSGGWIEALGFVFDEASGQRVAGHLDLTTVHHTPWGVVHGGVFATIVETVGSVGASLAVRDRGQFAVGVNNSTDFVRAATGGRIDVEAVPVQQGRVQQLWDVRITRSDDGKLIAGGRLRLQNVPLPA